MPILSQEHKLLQTLALTKLYSTLAHFLMTKSATHKSPPSSYIWQPDVPSVARLYADKPIYSDLPVRQNRGGTKSMGHTTHIKRVL